MSAQKRSFLSRYFSFGLGSALVVLATLMIVVSCSGHEAKAKPNIVFKKTPPSPGVVATINGQNITEDQLIGDDRLDFFDLKKREYDLKMQQLNKMMVNVFLGAKAKKAGMSLDDYISKKIAPNVNVSQGEYKKFIKDKHIPTAQINAQIKQRIMEYLKEMKKQDLIQNAVAKETKHHPVEVFFQKPKLQIKVRPGQGTPMWGNANAKVTIIEFSDFQCPFCARANKTVTKLKKKYAGKIKIYYRNFPLPMHPDSHQAAQAAMCVYDQGNSKFWKYADLLFTHQQQLDVANLQKMAGQVGANTKQWKQCYDSKKFVPKVQADMHYGEKIGVRSTPTFFINGQLVSGAVPFSTFSNVINDELSGK